LLPGCYADQLDAPELRHRSGVHLLAAGHGTTPTPTRTKGSARHRLTDDGSPSTVRWVNADTMIGLAGVVLACVGVGVSVHYARKADTADKSRRRLEWSDLQVAAHEMGVAVKKAIGEPVALLTPGLTGATFANLLVEEFPSAPPVYVGVRIWKRDSAGAALCEDSFEIETERWVVSVPLAPLRHEGGHILVVDDFVMSGDFLQSVKKALLERGLSVDRVYSVSIAATRVAVDNRKGPDSYWWLADNGEFYFPWGKAR